MSTVQEFDYSVDLLQNILWQYDNAPNLFSIVQKKQLWYAMNHTEFWSNWYDDVFNLNTANAFGLSVWALILDVPIFADNGASPTSYPAFGFDPVGQNFTNGNFASNGNGIVLPVSERRALLRLRYYQLTTNGSVTSINAALKDVFGAGKYVQDNLNMSLTYVLAGVSAPLVYVLSTMDILPRPAGVSFTITT